MKAAQTTGNGAKLEPRQGDGAEPENSAEEDRWFKAVRWLSHRAVVLTALGLTGAGALLVILAAQHSLERPWPRILSIAADALLTTGITTLVFAITLLNRLEIFSAVQNAFKRELRPKLKDAIQDQTDTLKTTAETQSAAMTRALGKLEHAIGDLKKTVATDVRIIKQGHIYDESIELLETIETGPIRILMSVEEGVTFHERMSEAHGDASQRWIEALHAWLDNDPNGGRSVQRVIAVPTSQSQREIERACSTLVEPFAGMNVDQWFLPDDEFSLSVMLLNNQHSVFGFPRPRGREGRKEFQYALDVVGFDLTQSLAQWFDATFIRNPRACIIMEDGDVKEDKIRKFAAP